MIKWRNYGFYNNWSSNPELVLHLGQEIYLFFYKYGVNGIFAIILCSFLISFIIYKGLNIIYKYNIESYKDFLDKTKKKKKNKYLNFNFIISNIINVFLIITFFIMIAGFGAYFEQELGLNTFIGASMLALICYMLFLRDIKIIARINSFIVPILILFIIIIGFKNANKVEINNIGKNIIVDQSYYWIINAILYASYNLILLIPVLINLKKLIKNKKHITIVSVFTGFIFFSISLLNYLLLVNVDISFLKLEMPIVYVIKNFYVSYKYLYGIILLISIFTTAVSIGKSFLSNINININEKSYPQIAAIMCISSVIISNFGFSNLVKILFPLFGYMGIVQLILIIKFR